MNLIYAIFKSERMAFKKLGNRRNFEPGKQFVKTELASAENLFEIQCCRINAKMLKT